MIYMFLSNNPSSGDINSLNLPCLVDIVVLMVPSMSTLKKRGSSVVRHLPLVLEVPGSIPARGEKNFGVRTCFL